MNKTVLISGSGRGIGRAIAVRFAKEGYRIAINSNKSRDELEETKDLLVSIGAPVLAFQGDVGIYEFCRDFVNETKKTLGSIDILINNAGISHIGLLSDMKPSVWNEIINTNLTSLYNLSSLVIPDMVRNNAGKIINISSIWGNVGASMEVAYSASKGGMNSFTKALAKELAPSNIQVNAIACGAIDTEMNNFLSPSELASLIEEIPASRLGRPEEVAELTLSLCTGNDYLTGQIISLDGGWC